jgi:nucleoside 2-deoxyribosyltransferase
MVCIFCNALKDPTGHALVKAEHDPNKRSTSRITCARCGTYTVAQIWLSGGTSLSADAGVRLSQLARRRSDAGDPLDVAYPGDLDALAASVPPPTFAERTDEFLLNLARLTKYPGRTFVHHGNRGETEPFTARLALPSWTDAFSLAKVLGGAGLIAFSHTQHHDLSLTAAGWQRVDELQRTRPQSNRAFVAMSFSPDMNPAFTDGIEPALTACGLQGPFRVDDPEHEKHYGKDGYKAKIDDRVIAEIRRAKFVVVDVTGNRSAVYYEAGFAEGLDTPVIWTCQEGHDEDMTFDTRQVGHIIWEDPTDLKQKLEDRIRRRGWALN